MKARSDNGSIAIRSRGTGINDERYNRPELLHASQC